MLLRRGKFMCERNSLDAAEVVWKTADSLETWVYHGSSVQKGAHLNREASNIAEVKSSNITWNPHLKINVNCKDLTIWWRKSHMFCNSRPASRISRHLQLGCKGVQANSRVKIKGHNFNSTQRIHLPVWASYQPDYGNRTLESEPGARVQTNLDIPVSAW